VKYWLHFGFLNINKEKMSKSLGNFFTAREVLAKYSAEAIRLFFVQAHYRGPVDFTSELLDSTEKGLEKLKNLRSTIESAISKNKSGGINPEFDFKSFEDRFSEAMDEDFNTPQAVAVIFDFVKEANRTIAEKESIHNNFYITVKNFLSKTAGDVLGIISFEEKELKQDSLLENELIKILIDIRLKAKNEKNFQLADDIRKKLESLGITLKDTKEGTDFFKRD
jgi:cysteinyl-tRNA synthetase